MASQELIPTQNLTKLREQIEARFSIEELRTICFDLGISYENLSGDGLNAKVREVILHFNKQQRLDELLERLKKDRSFVDWKSLIMSPAPVTATQPLTSQLSSFQPDSKPDNNIYSDSPPMEKYTPPDHSPYRQHRDHTPTDQNLTHLIDLWDRNRQNLIFFLGAGASIGARNINDEAFPQAQKLRNDIWREFMISRNERADFDSNANSTLGMMSLEHAAALAEGRAERGSILDFVQKRFETKLPLWQHAVLPFLDPKAIFTTNYDELIEQGWTASQTAHSKGGLKLSFKSAEVNRNTRGVPLYKPHGTLDFLHGKLGDGGMVLTQFDYFEIMNTRNELIERWMKDFNSKCVVFVGYSFFDMDIAALLYKLRAEMNGAPWYAVFPRNDDNVRNLYLNRYRIRVINRTFHTFMKELDESLGLFPNEWKFDRIPTLQAQRKIQ